MQQKFRVRNIPLILENSGIKEQTKFTLIQKNTTNFVDSTEYQELTNSNTHVEIWKLKILLNLNLFSKATIKGYLY